MKKEPTKQKWNAITQSSTTAFTRDDLNKIGVYDPAPDWQNKMKHKEHICRFNDGKQTCTCYDKGYEKGRNESIMALDKKVTQNFNQALKDESSDLIKMIQEEATKQAKIEILESMPINKLSEKDISEEVYHDGYNQAKDELIEWKNKKLKELE